MSLRHLYRVSPRKLHHDLHKYSWTLTFFFITHLYAGNCYDREILGSVKKYCTISHHTSGLLKLRSHCLWCSVFITAHAVIGGELTQVRRWTSILSKRRNLKNKSALITACSQGIGEQVAIDFAKQGTKCFLINQY